MTTRMFWATMLASTCLLPGALQADGPLPTDPNVVAGDITITTPGNTQMLVQQAGAYGIVDWGSFSIANGFGVDFQNGDGATLNRVTGNDLSQIMGSLTGSGSVYLINQNGIVFGQTGVVNTGGTFVASTLDIENGDFLDGGEAVFRGGADGYVINLGTISSLGGDVAILAHNVVNEGTVDAANGTVGLVAGREILMRDAAVADGLFAVRIGGPDTSVTEAGTIRAAAAELRANGGNVYALAGNTDGTIAATGVARVKGRVFLTAGDGGQVRVAKPVRAAEADGRGGAITVTGGQVEVSGLLDASGSVGGQVVIKSSIATVFTGEVLAFGGVGSATGGFVEVSGRHLIFGGTVDTGGGTVLIDPDNIEITSGGSLLAGATVLTPASIVALLVSNDVIIQTGGVGTEAGTIAVLSDLIYASAFDLTLLAHGDILAFANIQNGDDFSGGTGGDVNLIAGWDGSTSTTAFDPAVFDSAALATQTIFGNASGVSYTFNGAARAATGSVLIADGSHNGGIAVGSMAGATRVYANDLVLTGTSNPDSSQGYAQLGYNIVNQLDDSAMDGAITVRATGDIDLIAGTRPGSAVQIGHVGLNTSDGGMFATSAADINIETLGDLVLQGGTSATGFSYAMIGNGSRDVFGSFQASGSRSGDITVTTAGEISLQNGASQGQQAWIGHSTSDFNGVSNADIVLTAAAFDTNGAALVGSGGTGRLSVFMIAENLAGGRFTASATDSSLTLFGDTSRSSCECNFIDTESDLVIQASNDILLDRSFFFSNTGGGNVALAAGENFHNNAGANAFGAMKGFWRVYSTRPDQNTNDIDTMRNFFVATNMAFDPNAPFQTPPGTSFGGNGLIYTKIPLVTIDDVTMTYGDTLVLPGFSVTVDGLAVDPTAWGFSIDSVFLNTALVTFSTTGHVNAGSYVGALEFTSSALAPNTGGYASLLFQTGDLTVDQAVLTGSIIGTPTKVYDGSTAATLTALDFLLSGFVSGEGATVAQTVGTYASANVNIAGGVGVSAVLDAADIVADSATSLANYVLPTLVSGTGLITPASITATLTGTPTKVYDSTTIATLTSGNYSLSGFVGTDGATVSQTVGTYASADAGTTNSVTALLTDADFTATGATLLTNYALPRSATGSGAIDQATLTAQIIGTPTKVYDGNTLASLTDANFQLTGFVGDEGATVAVTSGSYASANASATNLVTALLAATDFSAFEGTSLANYILPASATGNGVITQATVTAGAIIGTPTKVYDGNLLAALTSANFALTGFVDGEGATVTETVGSYASANAGGTNLVTVVLDSGDFAATGGTVLANYILPTTVTGNGAITQATVTGAIIGTPTKVYDGTTAATLTAANFLLTGFVAGEGATVTQTSGTYASANASGTNLVTAALAAGDFTATGATLLSNYILPTTVTGNGAISQGLLIAGTITGTPTKVYDGTAIATLTAANFLLTGFVAGEGATVTQTVGSYASANASGANAVTVTLTAADFVATGSTVLANYVLPTTVTGAGAITQAALTGSIIGTPTKVYNGNAVATLTAANFLLTGFVAGEGATVTQTAGTYSTANAAATNGVTATLAAGDFVANGGTLLANYVLPTTVSGAGTIDRATLTASIIGLPTKAFDGTLTALLTSANFQLSGFVAGEGALVTQTQGTYATATAGATNAVTANLDAGNFTATGPTLLANYILPSTATGPGLIDLAPQPQPLIPETRGLETFETTPLGQPAGAATSLQVINTETTQRILDEIRAGSAFCKALINQEYVIDCLSDRLQSVADGLSAVGEYAEVRAALEDAAQQLHALALANASSDLAQQVIRAAGRRSSRPLTAVASGALAAANAQASAIIEGAELVLLRSSTGSAERAVAFTQVAQVVNSTKVLLRSS